MTLHGWLGWWNVGQLGIAGLAAMSGLQQAAVWRWEGSRSSARQVAVAAAASVAVLVSNAGLLSGVHGSSAPALFLIRATALAVLILSVLPLADVLSEYHPPRLLAYGILGLVLARLVLQFSTDLVYAHRFDGGLPEYGPLSTPTGLLVIGGLFAYLVIIAAHGRTDRERAVLASGILGSLVIAVFSFATADRALGELLTGYLTLPSLGGITALIWMRQNHAQRQVSRFAHRQHALANLSWVALSEPLADVLLAARVAVITHLPAARLAEALAAIERPGVGTSQQVPGGMADHDQEFVRAVTNVVAAARGRQASSEELEQRATHDELTGLPNRGRIRLLIDDALVGAGARTGVAVALCNLDRFRTVNDAYGHPSGDQILRLVADRLLETAWPCDHVGRFGSDEFVVICTDPAGVDSVDGLSDRIHTLFQRPIHTETLPVTVTASVGLVLARRDDMNVDADTLLRDAATAAHDAKARGAATGRFHRELRTAVVYRADIEQRLVGAVGRGEIVVHYQPIVDLLTHAVTGFEALARWSQAGRLVPPAEWIPVAETTEIIHEIGEHVLVTAARQTAEWHAVANPVGISVNVSARQLAAVRLERAILAALEFIPAGALTIEVTESMALEELAHRALRTFQDRGIRIALDDFGTGFSALASVARLPIDTIKIDQSITRRVNHPDGTALVSATIAIAKALNLTVVAEGVETIDQHRAITALGCRLAQGYLYGRPVDAVAATDLLSTDTMRELLTSPGAETVAKQRLGNVVW
jgi:diguanylate cyclase